MGVQLQKGQRIDLAKADGGMLTAARMGLGWDPIKGVFGRTKSVDLDASCILFDATRTVIDQVWFRQLKSKDGAIQHTGDNRTGKGDGDDESIVVDLGRVDSRATDLVFVVNSFTGQSFTQIEGASCRLLDNTTDQELARFELSGSGKHTALVMAKLTRTGAGWAMTAIGQPGKGRTFKDLVPLAMSHL